MTKVLIIEPDESLAALLELQLQHLGHESTTDPASPFEVAIVEPANPEGLHAARVLRERRPQVPLVFLSSKPASAETIELHPAAHLLKPVGLPVLREAFEFALGTRPPR